MSVVWRVALLCLAGHSAGAQSPAPGKPSGKVAPPAVEQKVVKSDAEWKKLLTPEQYAVLREKETERAFTGKYWNSHAPGLYLCAGCGQNLFRANTKFDSRTGWPSFWDVYERKHVFLKPDRSYGMERTEVLCSRCGGHLGHLFEDGPRPTGLRYCINSVSLKFVQEAPARSDHKVRPKAKSK